MKFIPANTRKEARAAAPWACAHTVKVDGGYMLFESAAEYRTWRNQK